MLLAYIDEVGEPGAFISPDHPRFRTSPGFGYAGFLIPEGAAREIGARFQGQKATLFPDEIAKTEHLGRWEKKGADVFREQNVVRFPQQLRVFNALVRVVRRRGGSLFYYVDEKPLGTPKQTRLVPEKRETDAMAETLNRLARHADDAGQNLMVMMDQINEKTRADRLPRMYGHIYARSSKYPEMRRILEPPMHIDSQLSANIQLADWVAACVSRAVDYQLVWTSRHAWIANTPLLTNVRGGFTHESKLHLHERTTNDIHHSHILDRVRPLFPVPGGQFVAESVDPDVARKMRGIAESSH